MDFNLIIALTVFAVVASGTPGPNNLMLLTSGANFGFRRTIPHISGIVAGFAVLVVLVGAGLMQLFTAYPMSYRMLKFASIAYLLFLAWKIATAASLEDAPAAQPDGARINHGNSHEKNKSKPFTFTQAALFQWVNPKGWTVALAALSAYTPPSRPLNGVFLVASIFGMVNILSTCAWTAMGVQVRRFLSEPRKLRAFNVIVALLLIGSLYPILFNRNG